MAFSRLVWIAGLVLGACWPLAFAPFDQSYLAIILLAGLFAIADRASPRLAAWTGFTFGLAAFAAGVYWLAIPLHNFAHMDWVLSGAAVLLLAFYCALYPGFHPRLQLDYTQQMPVRSLKRSFILEFSWLAVDPEGQRAWDSVYERTFKQR
jgi:apolipoprotein N-acyltransferase